MLVLALLGAVCFAQGYASGYDRGEWLACRPKMKDQTYSGSWSVRSENVDTRQVERAAFADVEPSQPCDTDPDMRVAVLR